MRASVLNSALKSQGNVKKTSARNNAARVPQKFEGINIKGNIENSDLSSESETLVNQTSLTRVNSKDDDDTLLQNISDIYKLEEEHRHITLDRTSRLRYYNEYKAASTSVQGLEVHQLVDLVSKLNFTLGPNQLQSMIQAKISAFQVANSAEGGRIDFKLFISLIYDILENSNKINRDKDGFIFGDMLPLDPESAGKQSWDIMCMVLLLYCSFSVPYGIAFDSDSTEDDEPSSPKNIVEILIDAIFMTDIILSFLSGYDNQGCIVRDLRATAEHYAKTWFVPDLAGSFPFDKVIVLAFKSVGEPVRSTTLLRALKLIRMLKLIRAIKFMNKLNKLKEKEGFEAFGSVIGIFSAVFTMIFMAHLLGCLFTMMIPIDPEHNWLQHYRAELMDADDFQRYVAALYWAMITISTMGYGDIYPVTHVERIFTIGVSIAGAIIFSFCMGTIASLISTVTGVDDRFQDRLRTVVEYLQFREIPPDLKRRVKSYYTLCWRRSAEPFDEMNILDELTVPLRSEIFQEIGKNVIAKVPILEGFELECVGYIAVRFKRASFPPGQTIYSRGDFGCEMYMIIEGKVLLDWSENSNASKSGSLGEFNDDMCQNSLRKVIDTGHTFGELALFPEIWGNSNRPETAVAQTWVLAYSLNLENLRDDIQGHYPNVVQLLKNLCKLKKIECHTRYTFSRQPGFSSKVKAQMKLELDTLQLKNDIFRLKEEHLLSIGASKYCCDIIKLLISSSHEEREITADTLISVSCIISWQGEILCVMHTEEGLNVDGPCSLGYLVQGRSTISLVRQGVLDTKNTSLSTAFTDPIELSQTASCSHQVKHFYHCTCILFASPSPVPLLNFGDAGDAHSNAKFLEQTVSVHFVSKSREDVGKMTSAMQSFLNDGNAILRESSDTSLVVSTLLGSGSGHAALEEVQTLGARNLASGASLLNQQISPGNIEVNHKAGIDISTLKLEVENSTNSVETSMCHAVRKLDSSMVIAGPSDTPLNESRKIDSQATVLELSIPVSSSNFKQDPVTFMPASCDSDWFKSKIHTIAGEVAVLHESKKLLSTLLDLQGQSVCQDCEPPRDNERFISLVEELNTGVVQIHEKLENILQWTDLQSAQLQDMKCVFEDNLRLQHNFFVNVKVGGNSQSNVQFGNHSESLVGVSLSCELQAAAGAQPTCITDNEASTSIQADNLLMHLSTD